MKQQNERETLQEAWSHAVEQASETRSATQEIDENKLASAAGLQLKANMRVGYVIGTALTASNCCTVNLGCQ